MKKIIIGLLMLMLMVASAMAMTMPHPIYGKITSEGYAVEGLEVRVKNMDTGANVVTTTNNQGFYQVDLGNVDDRYHDGDVIRSSLVYCEGFDRCTKEVLVSGGGNDISFDIEEEETLPSTATVIKFICSDGSTVTDSSLCSPEVEEEEIDWSIVAAVTIVIVGLGLAWACVKNTSVKGKYKWIPGMQGILKYNLNRYKELCHLGKKTEAKKKAATLLKYSRTITEKYLKNLLE